MKCPSCGKELERMKRQVGTTESGDPIFNEYAVCRDCKKQWNLDRQRARKIAAKKEAEQAEAKPVDKAESKVAVRPAESSVSKKGAAEESPAAKKPPVKRSAAGSDAEKVKETEKKAGAKPAKRRRLTDAEGKPVRPKASRPISNDETAEISEKPEKRPVKKKVRPASTEEPLSTKTPREKKASAKKPVKKRHPEEASDTNKASDEQKYGNIPAEQVRTKREKAVRKGYEEMLATDPDSKFAKKKKKDEDPDEKKVKDTKKKEQYDDEYDDDEYEYDDVPRFRPARIILGILSLLGFGYLMYRGFTLGLSSTSSDGSATSGMVYVILALCMLVSALLYFIMVNRYTIFAFLAPMLFYLASAGFAFLKRGSELELLIVAGVSAAFAVISLILGIASRGGDYYYEDDDEDEDYEDPFEDEHDN